MTPPPSLQICLQSHVTLTFDLAPDPQCRQLYALALAPLTTLANLHRNRSEHITSMSEPSRRENGGVVGTEKWGECRIA